MTRGEELMNKVPEVMRVGVGEEKGGEDGAALVHTGNTPGSVGKTLMFGIGWQDVLRGELDAMQAADKAAEAVETAEMAEMAETTTHARLYSHAHREATDTFTPIYVTMEDPCMFSCTSGSSGKPKACVVPHRATTGNVLMRRHYFPFPNRDTDREAVNVFISWEAWKPLTAGVCVCL